MPWKVKWDVKLKKYIVYKPDTGKVVGKHPSKEKAERHMRALYANVKE